MEQYEYNITVHRAEDILSQVSEQEADQAPPTIYCDDGGACYFDSSGNPYVRAIVDLFNDKGAEGWALLQVTPRQSDMICFWRRLV